MPGCARNIEVNIDQEFSEGALVTVLHTFTMQPATLRNNRDFLLVWYAGNFAANANPKSVQSRFNGVAYEGMGLTVVSTLGWANVARIVRTSPTSVLISHFFNANAITGSPAGPSVVSTFGLGSYLETRNTILSPVPNMDTNPIVLDVTGQGSVNNDVLQNLSIIDVVRL